MHIVNRSENDVLTGVPGGHDARRAVYGTARWGPTTGIHREDRSRKTRVASCDDSCASSGCKYDLRAPALYDRMVGCGEDLNQGQYL